MLISHFADENTENSLLRSILFGSQVVLILRDPLYLKVQAFSTPLATSQPFLSFHSGVDDVPFCT